MKDKKKIIIWSINLVLLIVAIWLGISLIIGKNKEDKASTGIVSTESSEKNKLFDANSFVKEEVTISTEVIEEGLRDMGTLITHEYFFTQVEKYEDTKKWGFLSSTSYVVFSYEGVVAAGIDCTAIKVSKDDNNKEILVSLPPAQIQYVTIDNDSFKIYEEQEKLWSHLDMTDFNDSIKEFKRNARSSALDKGIIESAQTNALKMVQGFVNALIGTDDYTVKYEQR